MNKKAMERRHRRMETMLLDLKRAAADGSPPPTLGYWAQKFGYRGTNAVSTMLDQLEELDLIRRERRGSLYVITIVSTGQELSRLCGNFTGHPTGQRKGKADEPEPPRGAIDIPEEEREVALRRQTFFGGGPDGLTKLWAWVDDQLSKIPDEVAA